MNPVPVPPQAYPPTQAYPPPQGNPAIQPATPINPNAGPADLVPQDVLDLSSGIIGQPGHPATISRTAQPVSWSDVMATAAGEQANSAGPAFKRPALGVPATPSFGPAPDAKPTRLGSGEQMLTSD
jgi:hypothetical protein